MTFPLSYIIFHPAREVAEVKARVLAVGHTRPEIQRLRVWMDNVEGNHDPCVLTNPWLYSYCHATQMRRSAMGAGSTLFFFDHQYEGFDTVFVVKERHTWNRQRPRKLPVPVDVNLSPPMARLAWDLQFKWPSKGYHVSADLTFEAAMWPTGVFSFLPMRLGRPVGADVLGLPWLNRMLAAENYGKRPMRLKPGHAALLREALRRAADALVIGRVRLISAGDLARIGKDPLAERDAKGHCARSTSR